MKNKIRRWLSAAFFVFKNSSRVKLIIVRKKFRERKGDEYGIISRR